MEYTNLSIKRLRELARDSGVDSYNSLTKAQLLEQLETIEIQLDEPNYVFLVDQNRWVLDTQDLTENLPSYTRVYDQKATINTSEERPILLTRAFNMENHISINDEQLRQGAEARGQKLGDASGGNYLADDRPERPE